MTVYAIDREGEENLYGEQQRLADAEKSQRAREEFEEQWEQEIRRARKAAGLCVLCGQPLSAIARIGGAIQHAGCRSFSE